MNFTIANAIDSTPIIIQAYSTKETFVILPVMYVVPVLRAD